MSETQCGRSRQLGLSQMWFLVTGTDHIAPLPPGPQAVLWAQHSPMYTVL